MKGALQSGATYLRTVQIVQEEFEAGIETALGELNRAMRIQSSIVMICANSLCKRFPLIEASDRGVAGSILRHRWRSDRLR
jgi:hypothetical protein